MDDECPSPIPNEYINSHFYSKNSYELLNKIELITYIEISPMYDITNIEVSEKQASPSWLLNKIGISLILVPAKLIEHKTNNRTKP